MKKYRGLRRRYKLIGRKLDDFVLYLDDDSWYSFFHIHLDWKGITDYSAKNRRSHIKWYLHFLDKIEILTKDKSKLFQTWIILDSGFGSADAIYFHTENPHSEFPIKFNDFEWDAQENELLKGLIDWDKYDLGRCYYKNEYYSYCIQKKGLGISLIRYEDGR
ncbi:MAG: hypothetical protein E7L01_26445 [Paenibacillus macerans]|uniref:Uncharacterized protein n=1 Tax=Paenibacillus macerans TaxID=44252 RepID=A0A6N8EY52_PAEMA|nr:hypothetical protein [Paenibacillus macerans]MDU7476853.1 hypothetical protein [Paenibacillus macerans]MUG24544.1 hypothetical protein [Paenibacillus macerans]UMV45710.1 hypothetical protein LMZ02_19610 [Paenibacillus macerans]